MAIEVYSLVVRYGKIINTETIVTEYDDGSIRERIVNIYDEAVSLCLLKLVETQRRYPKWIIERVCIASVSVGISLLWQDYQELGEVANWIVHNPDSLLIPWLPTRHPIYMHSMNLRMRDIKVLYPECKTMGLAIALDYIKDRL